MPVNPADIAPIGAQDAATHAALLALNNTHAEETSYLEQTAWDALIRDAYLATCFEGTGALLIAFDEDAAYDGVNFRWFKERYPRFVYVDRIIVAESHRGQGVARQLYENLFQRMGETSHATLGCEVNLDPPNPGSDAFHAALGFEEVGRAELADREKVVRYLVRDVA